MSSLRRWPFVALIALLASAFLAGVHVYFAKRLVLDPALPEPWRSACLGAIAALALSLALQPFGERKLERRHARWIAWPASLWMGFAFLLLVQLLATDALLCVAGRAAQAAPSAAAQPGAADALRAAVVALVALVAGAIGMRRTLASPAAERVEISLPRWARALDGFRIVQISDVHIGPSR